MRLLTGAILLLPTVLQAGPSESVVKLNGCSAVIIAVEGEYAYGLSASHCAGAVDDTFTFTTESGKTGGGRWKEIDRSLDLALFKAFAKDVDDHTHIIREFPSNPRFFSIAYPHDCAGRVCEGQQKTLEQLTTPTIRTINEKGSNKKFLRATFPSGKFAGGSSGGAVFINNAGVYGIITHQQSATTNPQMVSFVDSYFSVNASECKDCIECRDCRKVPGPPVEGLIGGKSSDQERRELIANLQNKVQTLESRLASLETQLQSLAKPQQGIQGPPGRDGKDGRKGLDGIGFPGPKGDTGEVPLEWERRLKVVEGWVSTFEETPFWFSFTDTQGVTGKKDYYYPFDLSVKVIKKEQKVSDE